ncbi:cation-transporting P-type ATPase [Bacillus licheniformis]
MGQTELLNITKTSIDKGLTEKEAEKRLERHGTNELQEGEKHRRSHCFFSIQRFHGSCFACGHVDFGFSRRIH